MTIIGFRRVWEDDILITLRTIDYSNLGRLLRLRVADSQRDFVAENAVSLSEAFVVQRDGKPVLPFAIYAEERMVGFLMIGYGRVLADDPEVSDGSYCLWRLMLDERWQGRGFARTALELALAYLHREPLGPAGQVWLSYRPENERAEKLYRSLGFRRNGENYNGEVVAVRPLHLAGDAARVVDIGER